tara:strand:- start:3449 stop:4258 length:810 start_codon:yes stop_codon:yes gene_type:complete
MKCIIVGLGYFGRIIRSKLEGHEIITVDPYNAEADHKSISDIDTIDGKWFVTTPATTHYSILLELFEKGVKDIWVEKPICDKFEDTLDIFSKKPDDVFLYCDFTWLQHSVIKRLGNCQEVKHVEMKWLNDGSMIPGDVNIVTDLAVHPISILVFFLIKSRDVLDDIGITYASAKSVLINGRSRKGITFNIEVSNTSMKKNRSVSLYCKDEVFRWSSDNACFIEGIGNVEKSDAIEANITNFFDRNAIGYPLDIARTLNDCDCLYNASLH